MLPDEGDVAVLEVDNLIGVLDDRACVAAQEELVVADAHHQRALLACSHYLLRLALVDDGYGVGTNHLIECHLNCLQQVEPLLHHDIFHELHEHFGVGIALEVNAFVRELGLDVGIVLYDSVMDNGQVLRLGVVRVGVARRGFAVSGPSGVGNTHVSAHVLIATELGQVVDLSLCFIHIQFAFVTNHSYASRVVAAILQSAQSLYQNGIGLFRSDVSYYSAHSCLLKKNVVSVYVCIAIGCKITKNRTTHKGLPNFFSHRIKHYCSMPFLIAVNWCR